MPEHWVPFQVKRVMDVATADSTQRRMISFRWTQVIWFLFLVLALSACSGPAERIWLKAPGWNRARLVANTALVDPVSMALDNTGNIYLLLFEEFQETHNPRVITLNRQAEVVSDRG